MQKLESSGFFILFFLNLFIFDFFKGKHVNYKR